MKKPRLNLTRAEREWALKKGEYWDTHSLAEIWEQTQEVHFDVDLKRECYLVALEPELGRRLAQLSARRGVSPQTLLNLWVREALANA